MATQSVSVSSNGSRLVRLLLVPHEPVNLSEAVCQRAVLDQVVAYCGATAAGWAVEMGRSLRAASTRELADCTDVSLTTKDHELLELIAAWTAVRISGIERMPTLLALDAEAVVRSHVERGLELDGALTLIRLAHARIMQDLLRACETEGPAERASAMRYVAEAMFDGVETLCRAVASRYFLEREKWLSGLVGRRRTLMQSLLRGEPIDADKATRRLGYDVTQNHIAAVVWFCEDDRRATDLERVATALLAQARCTSYLLIPADNGRLWVWGGQPDRGIDLSEYRTPSPVSAAVGLPAAGLAGMRLSHNQATTAARIGARGPGRGQVHEYRVLELVALLAADETAAADFVRRELGGLAESTESAQALRATLKHYLDEGRSASAAAQQLYVAKNTVLYRVRKAEQLRGAPLGENRLHLHAALHLAEVLGDAVLHRPEPKNLARLYTAKLADFPKAFGDCGET